MRDVVAAYDGVETGLTDDPTVLNACPKCGKGMKDSRIGWLICSSIDCRHELYVGLGPEELAALVEDRNGLRKRALISEHKEAALRERIAKAAAPVPVPAELEE